MFHFTNRVVVCGLSFECSESGSPFFIWSLRESVVCDKDWGAASRCQNGSGVEKVVTRVVVSQVTGWQWTTAKHTITTNATAFSTGSLYSVLTMVWLPGLDRWQTTIKRVSTTVLRSFVFTVQHLSLCNAVKLQQIHTKCIWRNWIKNVQKIKFVAEKCKPDLLPSLTTTELMAWN